MPTIDQAAIAEALQSWAAHISSTVGPEPLGIVGLISHGDVLAQRLVKALGAVGITAQYGAIDITLYRDDIDLRVSRPALRSSYLPFSPDGMRLILVDDVVQSGRTARAALETIFEYGRPARVELHCLADRGRRELPIQPDFAAFHLTAEGDVAVHLQEMDGEDAILY